MMQEYLVRRIRAVDAANDERVFGLKSKKAALAYQDGLRRNIRKCFGPLPRRTPLNARIVGEIDRDAYRIEKIIFESRPNFPVTANLYLPKRHEFPLPAVLGVCGHSVDGKAAEFYQSFSQGLARKGYVVLVFDPISQGERMQYPDGKGGSWIGACCPEHNHIGKQQILAGEFFGTWRVWDGIRALDYLLSRPEVDPAHVGITGNSGGGTMTTLLLANEDRFTMAAPSCYITTWRCNVENELPADAEQQPPKALSFGMDMSDLLMVHAPKPLIILTQEKDYFDVRGARQAYERLRHVYKLLGAPGNVAFFTGPDHHGYHPPNRRAMYTFFEYACGRPVAAGKRSATALCSRGLALGSGRHLALEREPKLSIEDEATLYCTESGQVDDPAQAGPATCFHFTREKSQALAEKRGEVSGDKLLRCVRRLLQLPKRTGVPDYRILRQVGGRGYPRSHGTHYVIETEPKPGAQAIVIKLEDEARHSRPLPGKGPAVLYLPHMSADEDLREDRLARELGRKHEAFFACDYRGIGESRPNSCGVDTFLNPYGSDYFYASYGLMSQSHLVVK